MKIASLVIGILLMVISGIVFLICLALPSLTNNRVNFEEALIGIIPSTFFFFVGIILTVIGAILVMKNRKSNQINP